MKIEMGESLAFSYLKHVEGCRIVQTNWKRSGLWSLTEDDKKEGLMLFEKIQKDPFFKGIFGENSFEQLLRQAELDVLGIDTDENAVYGVEFAFHTKGLNYADNLTNVLKKLARTVILFKTYFKDFDAYKVIFVTPKARKEDTITITKAVELLKALLDDDMFVVEFVANEEFHSKILQVLVHQTIDEHDGNELFLRAVKLLNSNDYSTSASQHSDNKPTEQEVTLDVDKIKIGKFVRIKIKELFDKKLLTENEIKNLQSKEYSKEVFNQSFEILRTLDKGTLDIKGRGRYYAKEVFGSDYYLTNHWLESQHRDAFCTWLKKFEK